MQNATPELRPINDVSDDFAALRKSLAVYADKTAHVLRLISDLNSNIVFASRPRRLVDCAAERMSA